MQILENRIFLLWGLDGVSGDLPVELFCRSPFARFRLNYDCGDGAPDNLPLSVGLARMRRSASAVVRLLSAELIEQVQDILRCRFHMLYFPQGTGKIACCEQSCGLLAMLMDQ
ncbi:MAG: hypothetical protein Q7U92_03325, partial [Bradyrhizobium sp.]|nr:hypothetical protein [Bradyrhizobium sp.]